MIIDPTNVFYDTNMSPHYHFYNEDTGVLADIDFDCAQLDINKLPDPPIGTKTESVDALFA